MILIGIVLDGRRRQTATGYIEVGHARADQSLDERLGAQVNVDPIEVNLDARNERARDRPPRIFPLCARA